MFNRKDDNLDEELAHLIAGDLDYDDEDEEEHGIPFWFDVDGLLARLRETEGVAFHHHTDLIATDVPLALLLEAQEARALLNLELTAAEDEDGHYFLLGQVLADGLNLTLASRSFAELDNDPEEES